MTVWRSPVPAAGSPDPGCVIPFSSCEQGNGSANNCDSWAGEILTPSPAMAHIKVIHATQRSGPIMAKAVTLKVKLAFDCRHRLLLRHQEELPFADRKAGDEEIRSRGPQARRIQGIEDQVADVARVLLPRTFAFFPIGKWFRSAEKAAGPAGKSRRPLERRRTGQPRELRRCGGPEDPGAKGNRIWRSRETTLASIPLKV